MVVIYTQKDAFATEGGGGDDADTHTSHPLKFNKNEEEMTNNLKGGKTNDY